MKLLIILFLTLIIIRGTEAMSKEVVEVYSVVDDSGIMGAEIFNFIGIQYKDLGDLEESERIFLLGIEYYKSYNLAYNLAGVFIELGDKENAKLMLQIAKIRKENAGVIEISNSMTIDEKKKPTTELKKPPHQSFNHTELNNIINILIKELNSLYQVSNRCEHINMFLGNLYLNRGEYLKAIRYFDREMIINVQDISGFSTASSMIRGLHLDKISNKDKLKYVKSIKEIENIIEALNHLNRILIKSKDTKEEIFKNTLLVFSIFEDMKKIISRDLDISLSDNFIKTLNILDSNPHFKLPKKTKIIKKMDSEDEVFKIFKTSNDIYQLIQYFSKIITYNMPFIK